MTILSDILFTDNTCDTMRSYFLTAHGSRLRMWNHGVRYVNLGLHQMLRELIPHCLMPLPLNRFLSLGQVFPAIMFLMALAKLLVHSLEPIQYLIFAHILQTLVLDEAIDEGGRHVRMVLSPHRDV